MRITDTKPLLLIVLAIFSAYLLFKLFLYIYRPFYLSRTFPETERMYTNLIATADRDLAGAEDFIENGRKMRVQVGLRFGTTRMKP